MLRCHCKVFDKNATGICSPILQCSLWMFCNSSFIQTVNGCVVSHFRREKKDYGKSNTAHVATPDLCGDMGYASLVPGRFKA